MDKKKFKFSYGDKVRVNGHKDKVFIVTSIDYQFSYDEGGIFEYISYTVKNYNTGEILDILDQDEMESAYEEEKTGNTGKLKLEESKILEKKDIEFLLDCYNDYISMSKLWDSLNQKEYSDSYISMANEIIKYLSENSSK